MRKAIILLLLLLTAPACVPFSQQESFEDKAATQVAIALTATALDATVSALENPVEPTVTDQPDAQPTDSPPFDPSEDLGDPVYTDNSSSWNSWNKDPGDQVLESVTTVSVADGKLSMQSSQVGKFHWWLNYRLIDNAYLEAIYETGNCSGNDEYGLVFRAPDYFNGVGYYFTLTCDGKFDLREKTEPNSLIQENQLRFGMQSSDLINSGPNQKNTLGVWMNGETIRLYINKQFLGEITDAELTASGHFGPFIYARKTPGFKISLDEISYWTITN
jgi:hypothetical protein